VARDRLFAIHAPVTSLVARMMYSAGFHNAHALTD
jgi:hypothetical protein